MCAAHACVRTALTQAFRPPSCTLAGVVAVPGFLVPALARPTRRAFSPSACRKTQQTRLPPASHLPAEASLASICQPKPSRAPLPHHIPLPDVRSHIQPWLASIDPFLLPHLRQRPLQDTDAALPATPFDFAWLLNAAQDSSQDLLSHMGLAEGRWDTVVWIVKKIAEGGSQSLEPPLRLEPFVNVMWPERECRTLQDLTNRPLVTARVRPSRTLKHSLDQLTAAPDTISQERIVRKRALGQIWRSLGTMILAAVEKKNGEQSQVMLHVLEVIAHLHHLGLIPESVYQHRPNQDDFALQQPPTLHLLSSKILTALSDASWRAHEASVVAAKKRENASYFLNHEIPGSHYRMHITEVTPELWLELVLWSCLHGGWILDGTAILEQVPSYHGERRWSLLSWREVLQAKQLDASLESQGWRLFNRRDHTVENTQDRVRTQKTISSEIVIAFVDALVNLMRVGVGARGTNPEDVVDHIKKLKHLLDRDSLSLGSSTWDTIMIRLLESGGVVPEKRPELLLSIMDLASGFGTEVGSVNASSQAHGAESKPRYLFEPSTAPINLLHRTMRSFLENGDISGAMMTMQMLQQYTDSNKQKSLHQFFEALKTVPLGQDQPFTSRVPPIDFPAFDTQLPVSLLAKLLDLVTDAKLYDLGRWFLLSKDLDGPLIKHEAYDNRAMASSIIRFGTMAGENDLVLKMVKRSGKWNTKQQAQQMPSELLTALLSSQVRLHRWDSVKGMQNYVLEHPGYRPHSLVLANFAAELLRLSGESNSGSESQKGKACKAFTDLLFSWEGLILTGLRNELYCVLGIMCTVNEEWKGYCSQFLAFSSRQGIRLSTADFNQVLGGVLGGFGSLKGKEIVDAWCYKPPKTFEAYRAPGGLATMAQFHEGKAEEHESRPEDIVITQSSGTQLIVQGRVYPNRQTVWAIVREVQQEEKRMREQGEPFTGEKRAEVRSTLKWAARLLYYLGFDHEDIVRDLGSLAELAELAAPSGPRDVELAEGEQGARGPDWLGTW
ncbi:hypothetical protein K505DRAFT_329689 [Melanomma pulvis-pyrius CBS 109.77]|uniref:Uncharacterized protein n=1 Tax=Melanomma pulvis-pyrius CBS 109.77 TaxID=1314802 RepID=A0A6A6WU62_9PLEO|nr:hypothetical protein K505DRAFT_329689 [Melanomma pulvis-pyrius CBS 109.77]